MTTHPKTTKSFAEKFDQYLREDCTEPPLTDHPVIRNLIGDLTGKKFSARAAAAGQSAHR